MKNQEAFRIENQILARDDQRKAQMCEFLSELDKPAFKFIRESATRLSNSDDVIEEILGVLALSGLSEVISTLISRKLCENEEGGDEANNCS